MQVNKRQVVDHLRGRGDEDQAQHAEATLPDTVDLEEHEDLLADLGVEPAALTRGAGSHDDGEGQQVQNTPG
ncbi:hypothetical protein [Angustibacter aerolatus]|uniref:Uncharacterized protein n=1 Tax=Angustibacter aerolatus TaxID=1162965 RepID=A0ABQ6JH00_9ACTN|nr:hypothetical protein [Angustibacter aerolatus]GMA86649.1 hypothetical protein GCM10025868_18990 [Angustibacter aerolatus]